MFNCYGSSPAPGSGVGTGPNGSFISGASDAGILGASVPVSDGDAPPSGQPGRYASARGGSQNRRGRTGQVVGLCGPYVFLYPDDRVRGDKRLRG